MDKQQHIGGGAKVTYIETQFVTSDAAGFKDLVQRLTGRFPTGASAAPAAPAVPHRPRAWRTGGGGRTTTAAGDGSQVYHYQPAGGMRPAVVASRAPPCHQEELLDLDDFSDLFYVVGAREQRLHGLNNGAYYSDLPY